MSQIYKREKIRKLKESVTDNFSFKLVALFISLILWLSVVNKRDFITTKEFDIDIITSENLVVMAQTNDKLKVRVSGPQPLLKKFNEASQIIAFDMTDKGPGFYDIDVSASKVDVPAGLKVLSLKPNTLRIEITEKNKN